MDGQLTDLDSSDGFDAFTFWLDDTLYALDIKNVLSIVRDDQEISPVPADRPGLLGVIRFQGQPVTVFDFAARVGESGRTQPRRVVLDQLDEIETTCTQWIRTLGEAAEGSPPIDPTRHPRLRELERWLRTLSFRDEGVRDALQGVHQCVVDFQDLGSRAVRRLRSEEPCRGEHQTLRVETLTALQHALTTARQQLSDLSRPVILYVTHDGRSVSFALRLDDLNNIIQFGAQEFTPASGGDDSAILGYLIQKDQPDCLVVNIDAIHRDVVVASS
ncbi:MAG: chemotaxis protein CheW [Planctomycetota bacterium]